MQHAERVAFFTPDVCFIDAQRYLPGLIAARGVEIEPALAVLDAAQQVIQVIGEDSYGVARQDSLARIEKRDADDWPVLATALVLGVPIWTEDQDFFGTGVPTWTTDRVELYLSAR